MHPILLTAFSLGLTCMTFVGAAAHGGRAGEIDFALRSAALAIGPAFCGLCIDEAGCSPRESGLAEKARDVSRYRAPPEIFAVIDTASALTGVDFDYLLRAAALESSFNPTLEATTSTAVGLYQFIEQSWLYMIQGAGAELGLEGLAGAIRVGEEGQYEIDDEEVRKEILRLRYDPELSAHFAALFTRRNFDALARILEREPDAGELYLAHVMGAAGAAELIRLAAASPKANAAKHFSRAARANRAIFYHRNKKPRSVADVIEYLLEKYRRIPVYQAGDGQPLSEPLPEWSPPLPGWQIGGDEIFFASR
ncbi:MAG: hypothetical protein IT539_04845 [Bradyrhizobiaceae bacterium]|nr:hypothetical protein [Bradyrhizobiaceae bacterium]